MQITWITIQMCLFCSSFLKNSDKLNIPAGVTHPELSEVPQNFPKTSLSIFQRNLQFSSPWQRTPCESLQMMSYTGFSVRLSSALTGLPSSLLCLHLRLLWLADTLPASNVDPPNTDTGGRVGRSPWFPVHPPPRQHWKSQRSWKSFDADWLRLCFTSEGGPHVFYMKMTKTAQRTRTRTKDLDYLIGLSATE